MSIFSGFNVRKSYLKSKKGGRFLGHRVYLSSADHRQSNHLFHSLLCELSEQVLSDWCTHIACSVFKQFSVGGRLESSRNRRDETV